jgi:diguanylate cyclase (GGDEF)-like protein/PAS domain S-box-containing protein
MGSSSVSLARAPGPETVVRVVRPAPARWRIPVVAGLATALGLVVLAGWLFEARAMTTLGLSDTIKANTAIGLILFGAGLALLDASQARSRAGTALVLAAAAIGMLTCAEYLAGRGFGIDELLAADPTSTGIPGRMSPFSAFSLAALGLSAVLATRTFGRLAVVVAAVAVMVVGTLNVFNALFGGATPAFLDEYTQMHPAVGAAVVVLAYGVTELLGSHSPSRLFRGESDSATMARRVAVAAFVLLLAITWLRVWGETSGLYHSQFGTSLTLVASLLGIGLVIAGAAAAGQRMERERAVLQTERDRFFDLSLDLLTTASAEGRFIRLNRAWTATLGYSLEELLGRPFMELVHPEDQEATEYEMRRQFAEGKTVLNFQNRFRHVDGSYRWLEWSSQPGADPGVIYAVARDITVRKAEEERLTQRAATLALKNERLADKAVRDALTGLHNRAYLDAALDRLQSQQRRGDPGPMSAVLFDLDYFGGFNKQYGHQAGDVVLRTFAALLRRRFRGGDIVARYGGEEFVVLLPGASREHAQQAADDVRVALEETEIEFDGGVLHATVSGGCAQLEGGMTVRELLAMADAALVQAKRAGRNMVVAA